MTTRVLEVEIIGNAASAEAAAAKTAAAYKKLQTDMAATAQANVAASVEQRGALEKLASQYVTLASAAKKGSDEQVAAARLAANAYRQLGLTAEATGAKLGAAGVTLGNVEKDAGRAERGALAATGAFGGMGRAVAFTSNAFLGGAGLVFALKAVVGASMDLTGAQERLQLALKNTGEGTKATDAQSRAFVSTLSKQSLFIKSDLTQGLSQLVLATKNVSTAQKDLTIATELARLRSMDLSTAIRDVVLASEGHASILRRQGIELPKVTAAEDALKVKLSQLAAVHEHVTEASKLHAEALAKQKDAAASATLDMQKLASMVEGANEKFRKGAEGPLAEYKVNLNNLEISLGQVLIPTMNDALKSVNKWMEHLQQTGQLQKDVKGGLDDLKTAFKLVHDAVHDVDAVTGSFKHTLELLLALKVGSWATTAASAILTRLIPAIATVGTTAETSTGEVEGLRGALLALGASDVLAALGGAALGVAAIAGSAGGDSGGGSSTPHGGNVNARQFIFGGKASRDPEFLHWLKLWLQKHPEDRDKTMGQMWNQDPAFRAAVQQWLHTQASFAAGDKTGGSGSGATQTQRGLVATAKTQLGEPYKWGGQAALGHPTDCSGLMQAVFRANGISIPRTSQEQYDRAPIKNPRPILPGDLVFTDGMPHPGHVGLYVGNGMVLEDPHTKDHVKEVSISAFGVTGTARWWAGSGKKGGYKGSGNQGNAGSSVAQTGDGLVTSGSSTKPHHAASVSLNSILPPRFQEAIAIAKGTTNTQADDLKAYSAAMAYLRNELEHTSNVARRVAIENEINKINKAIKGIHDQELKAKMDAIKQAFQTEWSDVTALALQQFDRETQAHLTAMQNHLNDQFAQIDAQLKSQLAAIESSRAALTPAEAQLKALQESHDAQSIADAVAQAQQALADAKLTNDPKQIESAQKQLDDALYNQQIAALQKQADAERAARDAKAQDETDAANTAADAQKKSLQDQYDQQAQAYQDQRDLQRRSFEIMLEQQAAFLLASNALTKNNGAGFFKWLEAHAAELGLTPEDVAALEAEWNQLNNPPGSSPSGGRSTPSKPSPPSPPFHGIPQAAGGDWLVSRPTNFLTGEAGPERVTITPLTRWDSQSGGGDLHLHFHGPVFGDKNKVARELAEPIQRELIRKRKRGAQLGLS